MTPRNNTKPKPKPKPLFSAKDERGIDRVVLDASTGNSSATDEEIAEDEDESDAIIDVRPLPAKDGKKAKPRPVKPKCGITVLDEYQKPRAEIATEDEEPEMTVGELLDKLAKAADGEGDPSLVNPKPEKRRPKKQAPIFRMRDRRGMERVSLDAGDEEEEEEELKMDGESASKYAEYMSKTRRFTGIKVKDELGKERLSMDTVSTPNLTVSELKEELDDEKKKERAGR